MAGFRHSSESGEHEFIDDAAAVEQPVPREPGWVEMFLGPNEHGLPLRNLPRPCHNSSRRPTRRPTRRRG